MPPACAPAHSGAAEQLGCQVQSAQTSGRLLTRRLLWQHQLAKLQRLHLSMAALYAARLTMSIMYPCQLPHRD